MKEANKLSHTILACTTCIFVFLFMIYIVVPMVAKLLAWFGILFVPEHYGGGEAAKNPGLIQSLFHGVVQSAISAYCAIMAGTAFFTQANKKVVAIIFGLFLSVGIVMFTYAIYKSDGFFISLTILFTISPAIYFTYKLWDDGGGPQKLDNVISSKSA